MTSVKESPGCKTIVEAAELPESVWDVRRGYMKAEAIESSGEFASLLIVVTSET